MMMIIIILRQGFIAQESFCLTRKKGRMDVDENNQHLLTPHQASITITGLFFLL